MYSRIILLLALAALAGIATQKHLSAKIAK